MPKILQVPFAFGDAANEWDFFGLQTFMASAQADWAIAGAETTTPNVVAMPEIADLGTLPLNLRMDVWIDVNGMDISGSDLHYQVFRDDGTLLGEGHVVSVAVGQTGKFPVVNEDLAAGTLDTPNGVYVTMTVLSGLADPPRYRAIHILTLQTITVP